MSHENKTYIVFDGDNDIWAYGRMKGWKALETIDFDFDDAHDIYPLTTRAEDEQYIKSKLRKRFESASQVIILIGKKTKNLYKYVRWELDVALEMRLPIIAVNLNDKRSLDEDLCPSIIRDEYVVHIPFRMKIIKYALDNFPGEFSRKQSNETSARYYSDEIYKSLGLN